MQTKATRRTRPRSGTCTRSRLTTRKSRCAGGWAGDALFFVAALTVAARRRRGGRNRLQDVKRRCIELEYPVLEEYDFHNDRRNPNLDIDLRPSTLIRPYQEKSLSKMFGDGCDSAAWLTCRRGRPLTSCPAVQLSRVGVQTRPLGHHRVAVRRGQDTGGHHGRVHGQEEHPGAVHVVRLGRAVARPVSAVDQHQGGPDLAIHVGLQRERTGAPHRRAVCVVAGSVRPCSGWYAALAPWQWKDLKYSAGITITTYTMVAHSGRRSYEAQMMMDFLTTTEWGLMILDEVHVVPADVFRKVVSTVPAHCKLGLTGTGAPMGVVAEAQAQRDKGVRQVLGAALASHASARGRKDRQPQLPHRPQAVRGELDGPGAAGPHRHRSSTASARWRRAGEGGGGGGGG